MSKLTGFLTRVRRAFSRRRFESEMAEEMRHHIEAETERRISTGEDPATARRHAAAEFGSIDARTEEVRDGRLTRWFEQLSQDLNYAFRMMGKTPVLTITLILTFAFGIGVNVALFAILDFLFLSPRPSLNPEELVEIHGRIGEVEDKLTPRFSYLDYLDYQEGTRAFSGIAAIKGSKVYIPNATPAKVGTLEQDRRTPFYLEAVSRNYFSTLGANIVLGRDFRPEEAGSLSGQPVIVVSHLYWQKYLNGDENVLGQTLTVVQRSGSGTPTTYTIIGVTAPEFQGQKEPPTGWVPLTADPESLTDRNDSKVSLIGRLGAGVSAEQAKAELDNIARRLTELYPHDDRANSVQLFPGMMVVSGRVLKGVFYIFSPVFLTVGLTLIIACLNMANLLLARGVSRQHEIGVRLALGASRGRIVRQLLTENFLLCALGAGTAVLFAIWTLQILQPILASTLGSMLPEMGHYISQIQIGLDWPILAFASLVGLVAGLAAGLAPALRSVRRDGLFALKHNGSALGKKTAPSRLHSILQVGQVAVCLTLLTASGMIMEMFMPNGDSDSGVSPENVYQMINSPEHRSGNLLDTDPFGAIESMRNIPGVASACLVSEAPLRSPDDNFRKVLVNVAESAPEAIPFSRVSAGFFETFGVNTLRGRAFTPHDVMGNNKVIVVSETAAERLWPNQTAIGKYLEVNTETLKRNPRHIEADAAVNTQDYEVIGVAPGIRSTWSSRDQKQLIWFPLPSEEVAGNIFVKLQIGSPELMRSVEALAEENGVPVIFHKKLATIFEGGLWPFRAAGGFIAALSLLALVMATIGLIGVVSFGVNQRKHEIGVRMALGATAERVTGFFVRKAMRLVGWGIVFGLLGGAAFAKLLVSLMNGMRSSGDPTFQFTVFVTVTLILTGIALVACWFPARRASRVNPVEALRAE